MTAFNLIDVIDLLEKANDKGILISFDSNELMLQVRKDRTVDKAFLDDLRLNKDYLVEYFKNHAQAGRSVFSVNKLRAFDRSKVDRIPLSFSQERLWFIDQLEGSVHYHLPVVVRLKGALRIDALAYALRQVVNRHEVLRTVIRQQGGEAWQEVLPKDEWRLGMIDWNKDEDGSLEEYIQSLIISPFALDRDHMLRADVIGLGEQEYILVVTLHHIASDGWSRSIIVRELVELYGAYMEGRQAKLPELPVQYADYAIWQRKYLTEETLKEGLSYWQEKLADVPALQLPTDHSLPAIHSTRGSALLYEMNKVLADRLQKFSQQQGVTLFMTLLAAFKVLLYRYSGQEDICVGTGIAGRQQQEVEGLVGDFVNTLALRSDLGGDPAFFNLLQQVKKTTLEAYEHQEIPFEKVVETVVKDRDLSRSPLFQVMLILQNTPEVPDVHLKDVQLDFEGAEHLTALFDINMSITEGPSGLIVGVEYRTDLFEEMTIRRMMGHYEKLLWSVAADPGQRISSLRMIDEAEERLLTETFNATAADYPKSRTVVDLFEQQADRTPDAIAVVYEGQRLSYRELDERSNQLGHYLRTRGVKEEILVPICMERSPEMIVGILAILKAGGAYVAVDPDYPTDRIAYMLEDTRANIVLSSRECRGRLPEGDRQVIVVEESLMEVERCSSNALQGRPESGQLAYVIYTSGSTGRPKGVMIEHKSLVNFLTSFLRITSFGSQDSFVLLTTYSFDISYLELYLPLIAGGRVIVLNREVTRDGYLLSGALMEYRPSHIQATPASWLMLLDSGWDNREGVKIFIGGEAVSYDLKERLIRVGRVWNLYGPTETTIWSSVKELRGGEKVLIGRPIANTQLYILDSNGALAPVGVPGELYIGGEGVARGYLHREELTRERFVPDPYRPDGRLYRTGDLGRWLGEGNMECLGRKDEQVKIRGYRVEPGEVERVSEESGMVRQVVVTAQTGAGEAGLLRLVGYVVAGEGFSRDKLVSYLSARLPEYMVPQIWVELMSLPLTANGKVNRRALPEVGSEMLMGHPYVPPRNEVEEMLVKIWEDLLSVDRIGIHDNFFELGGHSLSGMRVVAAIRRRMGVDLGIRSLFLNPTIGKLADHLADISQSI